MRVKGPKIVDLLANADKPERNTQPLREGKGDAALSTAVELGQRQTGKGSLFMKTIRLSQRILASGRIEHEQNLVGQARVLLF